MSTQKERKTMLKDWMTATTQLEKAGDHTKTPADISFSWRIVYGIKMTEDWVKKALYGRSKSLSG